MVCECWVIFGYCVGVIDDVIDMYIIQVDQNCCFFIEDLVVVFGFYVGEFDRGLVGLIFDFVIVDDVDMMEMDCLEGWIEYGFEVCGFGNFGDIFDIDGLVMIVDWCVGVGVMLVIYQEIVGFIERFELCLVWIDQFFVFDKGRGWGEFGFGW